MKIAAELPEGNGSFNKCRWLPTGTRRPWQQQLISFLQHGIANPANDAGSYYHI
jgi:hypothetical protein